MSEDLTRKFLQSFEERMISEFAALRSEFTAVRQEQAAQREMIEQLHARMNSFDARLTSLEEKVDMRLRETRPIWEGVLERLTGVETEMKSLNRHFRSIVNDVFRLRVRLEELEDSQQSA